MIIFDTKNVQGVECISLGYHPFVRPKLFAHCYFVDGLLIDTGQRRVRKVLAPHLASLQVEQIFITHHHEDHTGNVAYLQNKLGCPAYSSTLCAEMMKAPPAISFAQHFAWGNRAPFSGLVPKDTSIETEHFRFDIIPTPGHAPDMVVLHEPNQAWLFSADLYLNSYISYYLFSESMREQIDSITKVLQLDFEVLFCGHNPQFKGGKKMLQKKLDFLISFYGQVEHWHSKGYSPNAIFKAMQLRENRAIQLLSHGWLSKINMVRSVVRDIDLLGQTH